MGFKEELEQHAARKYEEYQAALKQKRQLELSIDGLRRYLEQMNPLLSAEGLQSLNLSLEKAGTGFATPGNRSSDMPPRQARFAAASLAEAVLAVLDQASRSLHANEIVRQIWDIGSDRDHKKAKHSLVSTLSQGVKSGSWERTGPNTYRAIQQPARERTRSEERRVGKECRL